MAELDQNEHERLLIEKFIIESKKERYLSFVGSKKNRNKFTDALNHFGDLQMERAHLIPSGDQDVETILSALKARKAPEFCFVISSNDKLDGTKMPLDEAIREVIGQEWGSFISCVAGKLGFFQSEELNDRYLLY